MLSDNLREEFFKNRIIFESSYIGMSVATNMIFTLLSLNRKSDVDEIKLYLGSSDGTYLDTLAIYDTIKTLKNPISTLGIGLISGYPVLLLCCGEKGKRYMLKHSQIYLSQPYTYTEKKSTQQTDIVLESENLSKEREVFENLLVKYTKCNKELIHQLIEEEKKLTAEDAVNYGFVDAILERK